MEITAIQFPWEELKQDFPIFKTYFKLLAAMQKSTPENMFFSVSAAIISIASEKVKLYNGVRHIIPQLWLIAHNNSGTGKSSSTSAILSALANPILAMENRVITEGTMEGLLKDLSDIESRLLLCDELHTLFKQCGCATSGSTSIAPFANQLLKLYGASPILKKTVGHTSKVALQEPKLVVHGNIQTRPLVSMITRCTDHLDSGFFARFSFYTCAYKRYSMGESKQATREFHQLGYPTLSDLLVSVKAKFSEKTIITIDLQGTTIFEEWELDLTAKVNMVAKDRIQEEYRNILQKADNHVIVIAMVLWYLDNAFSSSQLPPILRPRHVRGAILISRYLIDQQYQLFKTCIECIEEKPIYRKSSKVKTVDKVVHFVLNNCANMTLRDMYRTNGLNATKIDSAIKSLIKHKVGSVKYIRQKGNYFIMENTLPPEATIFLKEIGFSEDLGAIETHIAPIIPFEDLQNIFEVNPNPDVVEHEDPTPSFDTFDFINDFFGSNQ